MVLPQFSIRTLIGLTAAAAVMALIVSWGGQGIAWAVGATVAVVLVVVTMLLHAAMFGLMWTLSPIIEDWDKSAEPVGSTASLNKASSAAIAQPSVASEPTKE